MSDKTIIEKWIYEANSYVKARDENGNENQKYFLQDCEMDAYAFSYSVMRHKYEEADVYVPPVYKNSKEFNDIVDGWIEYFKKENL